MSPKVLHVFPSFAAGGIQMRLATILAGLPEAWQHQILSLDGRYDAFEANRWPSNTSPALQTSQVSGALPARVLKIRRCLKELAPDLLITNNWGTMEWALAARTLPSLGHIHTESGFGADEAFRLNPKRNAFRRLVLPGAHAVLLCSQTLVSIARTSWKLPEHKTHFVPDGIDLDRFGPSSSQTMSLKFAQPCDDPVLVGCVAPLRPEKNLTALLDAFELASARDARLRLAIAGDGSERPRLEAHARSLACADKVSFCGFLTEIERFYASIDICALSSDTEQLPNSILQAMCAGLPIAAFGVGDIAPMVAAENQPYITARRDIAALADAMTILASDASLRQRVGAANAAACRAHYGQSDMVAAYKTRIETALDGAA